MSATSNRVPHTTPVHVQLKLSRFSMSTEDLGPHESLPQKMFYPPRGRSWCTRGCKNSPPTQISHRFLALFFQSQSTLFLLSTQPYLQILGPHTERIPLQSIEAILNGRHLKNLGFSTRFARMAVSERLQRLNTFYGVLQKIRLNNTRNLAPLLFEELTLYLKS